MKNRIQNSGVRIQKKEIESVNEVSALYSGSWLLAPDS
jgi:hypothetical protein